MPPVSPSFDLNASLGAIGQGLNAVVSNLLFVAAWHGLAISALVGVCGLVLKWRRVTVGRPMMVAAAKLALFCLVLTVPGFLTLMWCGSLPSTGTFHISSLGMLLFWSLISLHLSAEETNYQWF